MYLRERYSRKGSAILLVFIFSILLSGIVVSYLNMVGIMTKTTSYKMNRYNALYITEAGINRIAWYLKNTAPDTSTNGTWRGIITEALGGYSYTATAADLPLEGPAITATSSAGANAASRAMDGNIDTYWRSLSNAPQVLTFNLAINGDYTIYLSRTRMLLGGATLTQFPRDYTWQISRDGAAWTTVVTKTGNTLTNVTDTFALQQANYIRLIVTRTISAVPSPVNIGEVELFGVVVPAIASVSSSQGANVASSAVDNNLTTYWQSNAANILPQTFTITFPANSNYSVNRIRMRVAAAQANQFPRDYTWAVSSDGISWTTVVNRINNNSTDITDAFTLQSGVNYLRLSITAVEGGGNQASIGEIDIPAACISSNCSIIYPGGRAMSYYVAQNVIVDGAPPLLGRQAKAVFCIESGQ